VYQLNIRHAMLHLIIILFKTVDRDDNLYHFHLLRLPAGTDLGFKLPGEEEVIVY